MRGLCSEEAQRLIDVLAEPVLKDLLPQWPGGDSSLSQSDRCTPVRTTTEIE